MGIIKIPRKYFQPDPGPSAEDRAGIGISPEKPRVAPVKAGYLRHLVKRDRPLVCEACGWGLKQQWEGLLNVHHVKPKSMGGKDAQANLVLLCPNHHAVAHMFIRESKSSDAHAVSGKRELIELLRKFDSMMTTNGKA